MAHIPILVHTDPRNFPEFEKWINSLDYGSRAYCREWRVYDINIQEQHKDKLLGDLKYHYKETMIGLGKKTKILKKIIGWIMKIPGIKTIDMSKIELTPKKWFRDFKKKSYVTHSLYLYPLGIIPDSKDKTDKTGRREEI